MTLVILILFDLLQLCKTADGVLGLNGAYAFRSEREALFTLNRRHTELVELLICRKLSGERADNSLPPSPYCPGAE